MVNGVNVPQSETMRALPFVCGMATGTANEAARGLPCRYDFIVTDPADF